MSKAGSSCNSYAPSLQDDVSINVRLRDDAFRSACKLAVPGCTNDCYGKWLRDVVPIKISDNSVSVLCILGQKRVRDIVGWAQGGVLTPWSFGDVVTEAATWSRRLRFTTNIEKDHRVFMTTYDIPFKLGAFRCAVRNAQSIVWSIVEKTSFII